MNGNQGKADDLQDRLVDFAVGIINLAARMPKTPPGRHVAGQILRSGTSPAPNYGEARAAESQPDFVHKLRVSLKELNETARWLQIIKRSGMIGPEVLADLIEENGQLSRILTSSIKTTSKRSSLRTTNDKWKMENGK